MIRAVCAGIVSRALRNIAPILASAALDITAFIRWAMLSTAPLFVGIRESFDRETCPPAQLRALGLLKQDASLCMAMTTSLLQAVRMASGWVAV